MKVQVRLNNYRRSASKVREIVPLIKGLDVVEAENQLKVLCKGSSEDLRKLLLSAVATAKNDFNLNEDDLYVENIMIQEGRTLKRWRARAYGRANQILKRSCHIILNVAEKEKDREVEAGNEKKKTAKVTGNGKREVVKDVKVKSKVKTKKGTDKKAEEKKDDKKTDNKESGKNAGDTKSKGVTKKNKSNKS